MVGPLKTGGKMRSYSIGAASGGRFTALEPYPTIMLHALLGSLSPYNGTAESSSQQQPLLLSKHVVEPVISRPSWANRVFLKLARTSRNDAAFALLSLPTRDDDKAAGSALLGGHIVHLSSGPSICKRTALATTFVQLFCI